MSMLERFCVTLAASLALLHAPAMAQTAAPVASWPTSIPVSTAGVDYQVGAGDLLGIEVYRSPDLSTRLVVSPRGSIAFPQLGELQVEGLNADAIAQGLAVQLRSRGILNDPEVSVSVLRIGSKLVSVMGAVSRPGEMPLDHPGMTLSAVLAQAGVTFGSGNALVTVLQGKAPNAPREQMSLDDIIGGVADRPARPGEILIVRAAPQFYVSGEVGRPGAYAKEAGMTVGQAIAVAGGITPRGSSSRIRIVRKTPDGRLDKLIGVRLEDHVAEGDLITVRTRIF